MKPFLCLPLLFAVAGCGGQQKPVSRTPAPDYEKGISLLNTRHDSAYYYLNRAATESKDSLQIAQAYNVMAIIQNREGDYFGAQESLLTSLKYLHTDRQDEQDCLLADYNALGSASLNLKNYDAAITYYDQALQYAKDERRKGIALNNKAVAYQKKGQFAEAIAIYESVLSHNKNDKKEYARTLSNLARVRWLQNPGYRAAPELLTALKIRKELNDNWGLNASYAHLADYYRLSLPDSALQYARNMYAIATQLNSPDDELEALQKLIQLSPAAAALKSYFTRYQWLKDSLETVRNSAKNQFALIRYEAEKNKADNARLLQENAEKRTEIIWQRVVIAASVLIVLLIITIGLMWVRKRKQKIQMEADKAIREEKLRTSQKVHDIVANGIYRIMTEIEYGQNLNMEELLDKLENMYIRSRDISYEPVHPGGSFQAVIAQLLASFAAPDVRLFITGNEASLWQDVTQETKDELKPILLELMINMKKHSHARNVVISFECDGTKLTVRYMDDGVGLLPGASLGNGLTSTENRIAGRGGRITFEQNQPQGLKIVLFFPNG